jgi:hypothetical protein
MGRRPKQITENRAEAFIENKMFVTKPEATPELVKAWIEDKADVARRARALLDKKQTITACRAHFKRGSCPEDWAATAFENLPADVKQKGRPRRPR